MYLVRDVSQARFLRPVIDRLATPHFVDKGLNRHVLPSKLGAFIACLPPYSVPRAIPVTEGVSPDEVRAAIVVAVGISGAERAVLLGIVSAVSSDTSREVDTRNTARQFPERLATRPGNESHLVAAGQRR